MPTEASLPVFFATGNKIFRIFHVNYTLTPQKLC